MSSPDQQVTYLGQPTPAPSLWSRGKHIFLPVIAGATALVLSAVVTGGVWAVMDGRGPDAAGAGETAMPTVSEPSNPDGAAPGDGSASSPGGVDG